MHIATKPLLPPKKINCAACGWLKTKAKILNAFTNGSNKTHFVRNVTALSKKISEAKKLFTIKAPCCAARLLTGKLQPIRSHPLQIAANKERTTNGKTNSALFIGSSF